MVRGRRMQKRKNNDGMRLSAVRDQALDHLKLDGMEERGMRRGPCWVLRPSKAPTAALVWAFMYSTSNTFFRMSIEVHLLLFFFVKRKSISSAKRLYKKNHLPCFLQSKDVIVLLQLLPSTTCYVIVLQLLPSTTCYPYPSLRWTWNAGPRAMQFTLFLLPPFPGDDLVATHDTRL